MIFNRSAMFKGIFLFHLLVLNCNDNGLLHATSITPHWRNYIPKSMLGMILAGTIILFMSIKVYRKWKNIDSRYPIRILFLTKDWYNPDINFCFTSENKQRKLRFYLSFLWFGPAEVSFFTIPTKVFRNLYMYVKPSHVS